MSCENSPLLQNLSNPGEKLGTRHAQIFLMFLGIAIAFAVRVCMSVTIVAMTDAQSANQDFPEFNWDSKTNAMILSSFFWGYIVTQVPSGYIASACGAQKLLSCGVFLCSVFNLLIPAMAVRHGWRAVICCRVATGLSQGCLFPCVQTLLSRWVPPPERARLVFIPVFVFQTFSFQGMKIGSFVMNAGTFGTVLTLPLSGALSASCLGWPSVFYLFGVSGIAWSILFFYFGADMPSSHPTICPDEMRYIDGSLGRLDKSNSEKPAVPWKAILTSLPVWSLIIVHSGCNWGFYTLLTEMPTYMNSILDFDVKKSGMVSACPYLAMWLLAFPISWLSDYALRRGVSVECVRKTSNTCGLWIPALAMVVLCLAKTNDKAVLVFILVVAIGFNAGTTSGFQINHIDLSLTFAGTLMSITNSIGNIFGILAPLTCGVIVEDPTNVNQWRIVFYVAALIYFLSNLVFIIFGKAEVQSWSVPDLLNINVNCVSRVARRSVVYDPTSVAIIDSVKSV